MRRTVIDVKWFAACVTFNEVRALYKTLIKQHHPDVGGSERTMQEINAEYDAIKSNPSLLRDKQSSSSSYNDWQTRSNTHWRDYRTYSAEDFKIKPGRYVCVIKSVKENPEKQYVALVFDIAEGKHKDYFQFEPWYRSCIYLSYKTPWQLEKAKKIINIFNASNPGFDGHSAFCDDRAYQFIGKKVIISLSQQYIDGNGFIEPSQVHTI